MIDFRKVEGEIFRLGTLLEEIQEQADDSKHRWAPSHSSCGSAHSSYSLWEVTESYHLKTALFHFIQEKQNGYHMFSSKICKTMMLLNSMLLQKKRFFCMKL